MADGYFFYGMWLLSMAHGYFLWYVVTSKTAV